MRFLTAEEAEDLDEVRQIISDTGILVRTIERLPGGSRSIAYAVDNLLVRFPKAEIIWRTMQREKKIIDSVFPFIEEKMPDKVHKIELIAEECPFSVSKRFGGKICDNRGEGEHTTGYDALNSQQQESLARQIAKFFALMHAIDYDTLEIPPVGADIVEAMESWDVGNRPDFDMEKVKAALLQHSSGRLNLDDYETDDEQVPEALCHNDLSGSNILVDTENYNVLNGIVDFGNARVVPIVQDFFPLYKINRKLALEVLKIYNKIVVHGISQKQIDGLALRYIGYGLTRCGETPSPYLLRLLKMFE